MKKKTSKKQTSKDRHLPKLFPNNKKQPKAIRNADYLSLLGRTKNKKKRQQLIALADRDQIDAISEIVQNILQGTLVLTQVQHDRLRRYKNCMRRIITRSTPLHQKKAYLQTYSGGGFIPLILSAAIPVIAKLLGGLFGK